MLFERLFMIYPILIFIGAMMYTALFIRSIFIEQRSTVSLADSDLMFIL